MQLIPSSSHVFALLESEADRSKPVPCSGNRPTSPSAVHEIETYIQIRDNFLAEAERTMTPKAVERVTLANEFVANCLKPAREPYQAQHLPEAIAMRERQRCMAVTCRLAAISRAIAARNEHAHAA
jgi:hypothetical protein